MRTRSQRPRRSNTEPPSATIPPRSRPASVSPGARTSSIPAARDEEVFLPLPMPRRLIEATTKFKSTWVVSSQNTLRARGLGDRYLAAVDQQHRDTLEFTIVGTWLPINVAMAHYQACDSLGLSASEQLEMGREVSRQLERTLLGTAVRRGQQTGTMWTLLSQLHRLWDRMFIGGGAAVYKLGPNESRIELVGCSLASISYFRTGLRGVLLGVGGVFTDKLYITEVTRPVVSGSIVFRLSWV